MLQWIAPSLAILALTAPGLAEEPPRSAITTMSFDRQKPGRFERMVEDGSELLVIKGEADLSSRDAAAGPLSMRMFGDEVVLEFIPPPSNETLDSLRFAAQRWTGRDPFRFRVEALRDGHWREVFNGDEKVPAGKFLDVSVPLDGRGYERYRFSSLAPRGAGLLVDEIQIARRLPMQIASITARLEQTPLLVGKEHNVLVEVVVDARGNQDRVAVRRLDFELSEGWTPATTFVVRSTGKGDAFLWRDFQKSVEKAEMFGHSYPAAKNLSFTGERLLEDGYNHFWLIAKLDPSVSLDDDALGLAARCVAVTLSNGETISPQQDLAPSKRLGMALRDTGDDNVAAYRIPGLATTTRGTLLAVYDARYRGWSDLPADIDVGLSRSTDGGVTWEPMKIIMDMGDDPAWNYDGVGDPCILVDPKTETIWVAGLWSHGKHGFKNAKPGLTPEETGQLVLVKSEDDGVTWSEPINITNQVKDPSWGLLLQGPGRGIAMADGTLVMPAQFLDAEGVPASTVITSKDHGDSWQIGTAARPRTTEAQVVEVEPGVLMLNMRNNDGTGRAVATTRDYGLTWETHVSSENALPEPVCMASLIAHPAIQREGKPLLLFANPAMSGPPRERMTIKASFDGGETWPESNHVLLDENLSAGYSCLSMIDEETIGIVYEGSNSNLVFQRIPLRDVIRGE